MQCKLDLYQRNQFNNGYSLITGNIKASIVYPILMRYSTSKLFSPLLFIGVMSLVLVACEHQTIEIVKQPYAPDKYQKVSVQTCIDRTQHEGARDLSAEATEKFKKKILASGLFDISDDAGVLLTCDVERFAKGSALKRWIMPGWGPTQGAVSVMVVEKEGYKVLANLKSQSTVETGGLYTIGAEEYILDVAFDGIIEKLKTWVEQAKPGGSR